ncbi:MAG: hypothetical protein HYY05_01070 [Chloroflexi bacterium]|nr:hypothetical protein [Chloroflexota bacterium]
MANTEREIKLTAEQENEGYHIELSGEYVLVWEENVQIALLINSADINAKVQDVIERRRKELTEIEEKTGWKRGT